MRSAYGVPGTRAVAHLDYYLGRWTVTGVSVPPAQRRKGHGSALLRQITADADREGVTLYLNALASLDDGEYDHERGEALVPYLKNDELVAWYGRHGFTGSRRRLRRVPGNAVPSAVS